MRRLCLLPHLARADCRERVRRWRVAIAVWLVEPAFGIRLSRVTCASLANVSRRVRLAVSLPNEEGVKCIRKQKPSLRS
jgi:hypothetical protein